MLADTNAHALAGTNSINTSGSQSGTQTVVAGVLERSSFWESMATVALNPRHRLVLSRLLDGFEGKLTTSKWAKLAKCSQDTAARDIVALVQQGILMRNPEGGRSTSYALVPLA